MVGEELDVGLVAKPTIPSVSGHFFQNVHIDQVRHEGVGGGVLGSYDLLDVGHRDDWPVEEGLEHSMTIARTLPELIGDRVVPPDLGAAYAFLDALQRLTRYL